MRELAQFLADVFRHIHAVRKINDEIRTGASGFRKPGSLSSKIKSKDLYHPTEATLPPGVFFQRSVEVGFPEIGPEHRGNDEFGV